MNVIHVAPAAPYGGGQRIVQELARSQVKSGHTVTVVWLGNPEDNSLPNTCEGISVRNVRGSLFFKCRDIRRAFNEIAGDVVHLHLPPPWVTPFLPFRKSIIVLHLHVAPFTPATFLDQVMFPVQSALFRQADAVIPVSTWVKREWQARHLRANYSVVFNGIQIPEEVQRPFGSWKSSIPRIGFASRLATDKGIYEFAEFAIELHRKCPTVEFLIAGDGPERAELARLTEPISRLGRLRYLGFVQDMKSFWSGIDLAVFCARSEAFGLRLIEPVAHNVPVISYRTGSGSDEILDLCSGIETVPYGQPVELATLAHGLLLDHDRRETLIRKARSEVTCNFSLHTMNETITAIYLDAIAKRKRANQ